jgi:hypothetical protein
VLWLRSTSSPKLPDAQTASAARESMGERCRTVRSAHRTSMLAAPRLFSHTNVGQVFSADVTGGRSSRAARSFNSPARVCRRISRGPFLQPGGCPANQVL